MDLSIVSTMYRSAAHLAEFCRRAGAAARNVGVDDYEIVLVNDGSPDNSLERAVELQGMDSHIKVVDLSRNFGHHKAMMTGLMHATGRRVFLIDCDLEESPEWLEVFDKEMKNSGADVVFGQQDGRKGGWFERVSGAWFYRVLNWLSSVPMPENPVTARLMTRRYVDALCAHRDQEVFILGLWVITGFKQTPIAVQKESVSQSTYTFGRKIGLLVNALTSFSNKPLVYISYLGLLISTLAVAAACYLIVRRLFFGDYLAGWPSLIVSIWLLGGLTILCLGVIGIYIAKIFTETKQRPYSVVRRVYPSTTRETDA